MSNYKIDRVSIRFEVDGELMVVHGAVPHGLRLKKIRRNSKNEDVRLSAESREGFGGRITQDLQASIDLIIVGEVMDS